MADATTRTVRAVRLVVLLVVLAIVAIVAAVFFLGAASDGEIKSPAQNVNATAQ